MKWCHKWEIKRQATCSFLYMIYRNCLSEGLFWSAGSCNSSSLVSQMTPEFSAYGWRLNYPKVIEQPNLNSTNAMQMTKWGKNHLQIQLYCFFYSNIDRPSKEWGTTLFAVLRSCSILFAGSRAVESIQDSEVMCICVDVKCNQKKVLNKKDTLIITAPCSPSIRNWRS